ncbi:YaiO family outer membrane beta-barrel protein [Cellulophaga sp. 20_2_10]|uniref:YaiO family outer membrane beta-barrel protein n=1 Tax=Cellulophaga sp. 20_2_10 TaxID=2942476 RepID=UPI00201B1129|nr:YaiO family outer membrane beta-barrel protein [Cellulophaga sp. 20_2_10]MCL5244355.1 YaiO family outer membrane beta-barrel protein [Cellulophaga sp. 20_2_10]
MKYQKYITLVSLILFVFTGFCQSKEYTGDPDASFLQARTLAFANKRIQARDTLKRILSKYPKYTDVENLLAKTLTWDAKYDEARLHFNNITSRDKTNSEVWVAAIKNELYAENYQTALGLSNKGLLYLNNNRDLINLKNEALIAINSEPDILQTIPTEQIIAKNKTTKNAILLSADAHSFNTVYDPMYFGSIAYKRTTKFGAILPTINYSNRFSTDGLQFQVDAYPKLSKKMYGYASYAFSNAVIYPNHRVGAEVYKSLPKSLEASIGARYLQFKGKDATVLTASISWYPGNYYVSWRPYVNPSGGSISFSNSFTVRRYLKDKNNYLGFQFGFGFSPETTQLTENNVLLSESIFYLESQEALLTYNFTAKSSKNIVATSIGVTRQELIFTPNEFYLAVSGGLKYQFNW